MVNFIKAKNISGQRIVLFQTGNYQYEIWNQTTKKTVEVLWDSPFEDAVKIFNEI
jgi:hypothetical protein